MRFSYFTLLLVKDIGVASPKFSSIEKKCYVMIYITNMNEWFDKIDNK